jgi:multiple sugar transport system substrate-binding protein
MPDVFNGAIGLGAGLVKAGALNNIFDRWMALPNDYRAQFSPDLIETLSPEPGVMYALPHTGYGYLLYRNLNVLREAGIDPNEKVETWDEWLAQMEKIEAAGFTAIPNLSMDIRSVRVLYNSLAQPDEWGIDFGNNKSLINPDAYVKTAEFLLSIKPYATEASFGDQSIPDLFISNKIAFQFGGPWVNPTYAAAKESSGLDYDVTVIPGAVEGRISGVQGGEFMSINTKGKHADLAWEFLTFMEDSPAMLALGEELGRFNHNSAAMAKVQNPLVGLTLESTTTGGVLFDNPPFFVEPYPENYENTIVDNMMAIYDGHMTPQEGVNTLIPALNELIANRDQ